MDFQGGKIFLKANTFYAAQNLLFLQRGHLFFKENYVLDTSEWLKITLEI